MRKRITAAVLVFFCAFGLLAARGGSTAFADARTSEDTFSGEMEVLKQENGNYVMQVTVENSGEDFVGTVQAVFESASYSNCAYNTEITLPSQGKKQFTVTVTERAADPMRGLCQLNFIDEDGNLRQSVSLKNVFGRVTSGISVGILSDDYSGLTYLDAGGNSFVFQNEERLIELIELDADNLDAYLQSLYFLVIDQFNVSSLSEESIQAIEEWVQSGGWLLIGTGAYADQTLSGFDEDFVAVEIQDVTDPGAENTASVNADRYGYYYSYTDLGIDFTQMASAEFGKIDMAFSEDTEHPAVSGAMGEGSVMVYEFSLGEKELQKLDDYVVGTIYNDLMYASNYYYASSGYSDLEHAGMRALSAIDNCNIDMDFTWLKVLIGAYVILVGPILYLVLRKCKKSEWYWICAPAMGIVFIAGVYVFGRSVRVSETRLYSVTAQRTDSNREDTYFLAYHSGIKEWDVRLKDTYEVAGPGWEEYYGSHATGTGEYYYAVSQDGDGMSIGIKPQENFQSGYLYASGSTERKGSLTVEGIEKEDLGSKSQATVTNDTAYDMAYMAVKTDSYIMIFSDVKAGETIHIAQADKDGRCVYQSGYNYFDDLSYDLVPSYVNGPIVVSDRDNLAALLIGIGTAEEEKPSDREYVVLVGVVEDYDKTAAGRCDEMSYGCLYSYVGLEVDENAAD